MSSNQAMAIPKWIKTLDTCKLLRNIIYIILHPFFWNPILLRVEVIRMEWQVQSVSNPFCWIIALETTHNYHNFFSKWVYQKLECSKNSSSSISSISLVILGIILIPHHRIAAGVLRAVVGNGDGTQLQSHFGPGGEQRSNVGISIGNSGKLSVTSSVDR